MTRGPDKQFDPQEALKTAMEIFWAKGYASTGLAELQEKMGIGRKSLYDTFGNKRQLFIQALQLYSDTLVRRLIDELNKEGSPLDNVRRVLRISGQYSGMPNSKGCLLGVSMAQSSTGDEELAEILRRHMKRIENGLFNTFERAQEAGELDENSNIRDLARLYMGILQGLHLVGRIQVGSEVNQSIADAAISMLEKR